MNISSLLIPSKFIMLTCHFITTIIVISGRRENILADFNNKLLDTGSDTYSTADTSIFGCAILSIICIVLEIIMVFMGTSMFYDVSNFMILTLHSVGVIVYSQFVLEAWPYYELWYYWAGFCLLPLFMEIAAQCFGNILYGTAFSRRQSRKGI